MKEEFLTEISLDEIYESIAARITSLYSPEISEEEIDEKEDNDRCPKCKSIYIMEHRYDDSYRICMSCKHNWRT